MALTDNINFLSPLGFRLILQRAPNVEYFCQGASLPSINMNSAFQSSPLLNIPRAGDKINYEPLSLRFRLSENMDNYFELYNWMIGLGHPRQLNQYDNLYTEGIPPEVGRGIASDGTIIVLSSNANGNIRLNFENLFPVSLSPLQFDVTESSVEYLECDVSFNYTLFTVDSDPL
jgi:hypothetical protein